MEGDRTLAAPPPEIAREIRECMELAAIRDTPGMKKFLSALDELRGLNYLDILQASDPNVILELVGEGRAYLRVSQLLNEKEAEGRALAEKLDGASAAYRSRKAAEQRTLQNFAASGPRRSLDSL